jgi:tRNA nucleotidyltransferase (CCA-adding enzyme)
VAQFPQDINSYLAERLATALPEHILTLLRQASALAAERGWALYLVGGYARDLLLAIPDRDIDISVAGGDAVELANLLAQDISASYEMEAHAQFGTATLTFGDNIRLDMVTARRETYPHPGALPIVEPGDIEDDLARRDFSINAMAFSLAPNSKGSLLDPHGGSADLQAGLVRVLHDKSFVDDPTRIFRAVKLAERLGFKIEKQTLELVLQAVRDGALYTISTDRAVRELLLILEEPKADYMLAGLEKLGVLSSIHPDLSWPYAPGRIKPAETASLTHEARRDTYLAALGAEQGSPGAAESLARALGLTAPMITMMRDAARLAQLWPSLGEEAQPPSQTYSLLKDLDVRSLEAYGRIEVLSQDAVAWQRLHLYLDRLRHAQPEIKGDYLRSLGIEPGPIYKWLLDDLLRAKLDGEVPQKANEERFVREWLRKEGLLPGE